MISPPLFMYKLHRRNIAPRFIDLYAVCIDVWGVLYNSLKRLSQRHLEKITQLSWGIRSRLKAKCSSTFNLQKRLPQKKKWNTCRLLSAALCLVTHQKMCGNAHGKQSRRAENVSLSHTFRKTKSRYSSLAALHGSREFIETARTYFHRFKL